MALAWLLAQSGGDTHALTVDHGLRADSAAEAVQVGQWANALNIRHQVLTLPHPPAGMAAARRARYAAMADYCADHGIGTLFLAHHQDDQAETLLFRLAKGSGLDGLAGMRTVQLHSARLTLRRPLLGMPKAWLVATCVQHGLPYIEDPTNTNSAFARNRLRAAREVLAGEGLTAKRLAVTALRLRRAAEALDHYAVEVAAAAFVPGQGGDRVFDLSILAAAPAEIRLRVILNATGNRQAMRREKIEALAEALFAPAPFPRQTLGGFIFTRDDTRRLLTVAPEAGLPSTKARSIL